MICCVFNATACSEIYTLSLPDALPVFSRDGNTLVSASADNTVRIWNPKTGQQVRSLSGHSGTVFGLALSADSAWIVSAGGDNTVRLWDRLSGRQLKQINAPGALYTVAIHPDGKTVAAAGIDRKVFIYDVFNGTLKATLEGHPDYIYRVAFNHAGNRLLSCGYSGHLVVWDFPSGKQLYAVRASGVLNSVAYAPDDSRIVVASDDRSEEHTSELQSRRKSGCRLQLEKKKKT